MAMRYCQGDLCVPEIMSYECFFRSGNLDMGDFKKVVGM